MQFNKEEFVMSRYVKALTNYYDELEKADVRGQYNSVFRTYSTTQKDVKLKYKQVFETLNSYAKKLKVDLDKLGAKTPEITIDEAQDEVLG